MLGQKVPVRARVTAPVRGAGAVGRPEGEPSEVDVEPSSKGADGASVGAATVASRGTTSPAVPREGATDPGAARSPEEEGAAGVVVVLGVEAGSPKVMAGASLAAEGTAGSAGGDGTC